jgi:N-methylhydantoinase A
VDARYPGQVHELTLPIRAPSDGAYSAQDLAEIERAFHAVHEDRFSYARRELAIEFMHWRVSAVGQLPPIAALVPHEQHAGAGDALLGRRQAYSPETGAMTALPVYAAHRIGTTDAIDGPAIIQAETTTVLIGPGDRLTLGAGGVMSVQIAADEAVVKGAQRRP